MKKLYDFSSSVAFMILAPLVAYGQTPGQAPDQFPDRNLSYHPSVDSAILGSPTVNLEFLYMTRDRDFWDSDEDPLLYNETGAGVFSTTFSGDDFRDPWKMGGRVSIAFPMGMEQSVQLRGFGLAQTDDEKTIINSQEWLAAAYIPPLAGGGDIDLTAEPNARNAYAANLRQTGFLWGGELTYAASFPSTGTFQWGASVGLRYNRLEDRLRSVVYDDPQSYQGMDNTIDRADIEMANNLLGVNLGVHTDYTVWNQMTLRLGLGGGLYANRIYRDRDFSQDDQADAAPFAYSDSSRQTVFAQGLEGDVGLTWSFDPAIALTLGYQALWLNNVALADPQYQRIADSGYQRFPKDDVLFHGARIGIRFGF